MTLTRPPHVPVDPEGDLEATVIRVVRQEDGARVELGLEAGTVWCWVARDGIGGEPPAVEERVRPGSSVA